MPIQPSRPPEQFVLIVEDDTNIAEMLARVLAEEGYGTMQAGDGKAALEILQQQGVVPSVILLDLMMPRMGGLEFVERLERDDTFCGIPIILMSSHTALARGDKVRNLHFLPKPFKPEELVRLVGSLGRQSFSRWVVPGVDRLRVSGQK